MKRHIKKLSLNAALLVCLVFTASCGEKKDKAALKAAEDAKAKFIKHTSHQGIASLIVEGLAANPIVGKDRLTMFKDYDSLDLLKQEFMGLINMYVESSSLETSSKDGIGVLKVVNPAFILKSGSQRPPKRGFSKDFALKYTFPDTNIFIDPNSNGEINYVSNGLGELLVIGVPKPADSHMLNQIFPKRENGYLKFFGFSGDTKGKLTYNKTYKEEGGSLFPLISEHKTDKLKFLVTNGNVAVITIDSFKSNLGIVEHNEERTIVKSQNTIKNITLGDMLKMVVGDVKPFSIFTDIVANITYKPQNKDSLSKKITPFKAINLDFNKLELQTIGSAIKLKGSLNIAHSLEEDEKPLAPNLDANIQIDVVNYKELITYIKGFIPYVPKRVSEQRIYAYLQSLTNNVSDTNIQFEITYNKIDGLLLNGKTREEVSEIFKSHFPDS